ncbi:MAG: hypothetical protein ABEI39_01800 [Halobacteriales archaeon]
MTGDEGRSRRRFLRGLSAAAVAATAGCLSTVGSEGRAGGEGDVTPAPGTREGGTTVGGAPADTPRPDGTATPVPRTDTNEGSVKLVVSGTWNGRYHLEYSYEGPDGGGSDMVVDQKRNVAAGRVFLYRAVYLPEDVTRVEADLASGRPETATETPGKRVVPAGLGGADGRRFHRQPHRPRGKLALSLVVEGETVVKDSDRGVVTVGGIHIESDVETGQGP